MGEVAALEENEVHVPPRSLAHRLDSMPALVPRSGLDPPPVSDAWALGKSARVNKGGAQDGFNGAHARLVGIPLDGIR